jgi:sec-independent protein translocase protein TatC
MANEEGLTLVEHLEELRNRLVRSGIALAITTLFSLLFTSRFLKLLIAPAGDIKPVFLRPTEGFITYMRVALLSGVILALPVIVYQVIRFITPGLKPSEARYVYVVVPGALLSFVAGVSFSYFAMVPFALRYLLHFGSEYAVANWAIGEYIDFVTTLMFWVGVVFETPLAVFFLTKLHIVNYQMLAKNRKWAILVSAILAAVITPTSDPFNMLMLMVPLVILYEISIWVSRLA